MSEPQEQSAVQAHDQATDQATGQAHDQAPDTAPQTTGTQDPLRGSRTSRGWLAVTALAVVFVLLVVFVAQNTSRVPVRFFGWTWHAPLAVEILVGAVAGMVLAVVAGTLRIWQLHRRVRRAARPV
jgi:uncharacterized integral membrane protein